MASATLEAGPQLQWQTWWEEARAIEELNRARGHESSQDQILSEGRSADVERQITFGGHTLTLCCIAASWTRLKNQERGLNHLLKLYKAQRSLH